jgi:hypothetical protein
MKSEQTPFKWYMESVSVNAFRIGLCFFQIALVCCLQPSQAIGCLCGVDAVEKSARDAKAVFTGTVIQSVPRLAGAPSAVYTFRVSKTWKGPSADVIEMVSSFTSCARSFEVGEDYLVYGSSLGNGTIPIRYYSDMCDRTRLLRNAENDIVELNRLMNVMNFKSELRLGLESGRNVIAEVNLTFGIAPQIGVEGMASLPLSNGDNDPGTLTSSGLNPRLYSIGAGISFRHEALLAMPGISVLAGVGANQYPDDNLPADTTAIANRSSWKPIAIAGAKLDWPVLPLLGAVVDTRGFVVLNNEDKQLRWIISCGVRYLIP